MTPHDGTTDAIVAALRATLVLSTGEGKWSVEVIEINTPKGITRKPVVLHKPGGPPYHLICQCELSYDATFIVLAHNALPALLSDNARLTSALAAAEARLAEPLLSWFSAAELTILDKMMGRILDDRVEHVAGPVSAPTVLEGLKYALIRLNEAEEETSVAMRMLREADAALAAVTAERDELRAALVENGGDA